MVLLSNLTSIWVASLNVRTSQQILKIDRD